MKNLDFQIEMEMTVEEDEDEKEARIRLKAVYGCLLASLTLLAEIDGDVVPMEGLFSQVLDAQCRVSKLMEERDWR